MNKQYGNRDNCTREQSLALRRKTMALRCGRLPGQTAVLPGPPPTMFSLVFPGRKISFFEELAHARALK